MENKQIEDAANKTIEDMKVIFRFQIPNKKTNKKTMFIPEKKLGIIRYLLIKHLTSHNKAKESQ